MYRYTLCNTPLVTNLVRLIALLLLRLWGWKTQGELPDKKKFIVVAYPHTSNWDVPLTLAVCLKYRIKVHWMGKSSLFRGPMGPLMKWLGGIPVVLGESRNTVQQIIDAFDQIEELVIVIAPEANRAYVENWKTGFYYIAIGAGVPIVLGFLDYGRRRAGYLKTFEPGEDPGQDLELIKAEYRGIKGLYPEQSAY